MRVRHMQGENECDDGENEREIFDVSGYVSVMRAWASNAQKANITEHMGYKEKCEHTSKIKRKMLESSLKASAAVKPVHIAKIVCRSN